MNHMSKVMMMILLEKLKPQLELSEEQAGFKKNRSTIQQILTLRLIAEKALEKENKKFELMLTRRAKAYSSSCSQTALAYLQPFRRN